MLGAVSPLEHCVRQWLAPLAEVLHAVAVMELVLEELQALLLQVDQRVLGADWQLTQCAEQWPAPLTEVLHAAAVMELALGVQQVLPQVDQRRLGAGK